MKSKYHNYTSEHLDDGVFVKYSYNKNIKITLFVFHDLCEHHKRFEEFFQNFLNYKKINLVYCDFKGHGLSSGTRSHFENFANISRTIEAVINKFKEDKKENDKWLMLGHGLGGMAIIDFIRNYNPDTIQFVNGIILSNFIPLASDDFILKNEFKSFNLFRKNRVISSQKNLVSKYEQLKYDSDPFLLTGPTQLTIDSIKKKIKELCQDSYYISNYVLLLNSTEKNSKCYNLIEQFSKGIKKDFLTKKHYPHLRHDLYNDKNNELVLNDLIIWVSSYE